MYLIFILNVKFGWDFNFLSSFAKGNISRDKTGLFPLISQVYDGRTDLLNQNYYNFAC